MKKILFGLFISIAAWSCVKSYSGGGCSDIDPSAEQSQIASFCLANGIIYTTDSNGVFYQIIDSGSGATPTANSRITISYKAYFLNLTVVDSTATGHELTTNLNQLIPGWQIGIPYIKKGGHIKLVIPSAFCYGCYGYPPGIPPNSILYFDINLIDVL